MRDSDCLPVGDFTGGALLAAPLAGEETIGGVKGGRAAGVRPDDVAGG